MYKLEQLHSELNVAKTTGTKFYFSLSNMCRYVCFNPAAHGLHIINKVGSIRRAPDENGNLIYIAITKVFIPGRSPCLEQRLKLPCLGPLVVVSNM